MRGVPAKRYAPNARGGQMSQAPPPTTPPRRATLKDVARAAGVSQSTTSRALSGEGYVAPAVRERVVAAAEELGYVAHAMARSLRKQNSRSVGVLVSDLRNSFYAELAAGLATAARPPGKRRWPKWERAT